MRTEIAVALISAIASVGAAAISTINASSARIDSERISRLPDETMERTLDIARKDFTPVGAIIASSLPEDEFAVALGEKAGAAITDRTWILGSKPNQPLDNEIIL